MSRFRLNEEHRRMLPFVAPFLVFMVLLSASGFFPDAHYLLYSVRILGAGGVILAYGRHLPTLRPCALVRSILVGVLGVVIWVGLDPFFVHYQFPLVGRNPFQLYAAPAAWILYGFRLLGMAICVPITEELFWRGFLMRWLIREDFTSVPMGTYRPVSFFVTTALFASVHGAEWPLAIMVGLIYGAWFVRTKRLGDVMVAHGVTNFLLGLYCLVARDWHFLSIVDPART